MIGQRVVHARFGRGVITEGPDGDDEWNVRFDGGAEGWCPLSALETPDEPEGGWTFEEAKRRGLHGELSPKAQSLVDGLLDASGDPEPDYGRIAWAAATGMEARRYDGSHHAWNDAAAAVIDAAKQWAAVRRERREAAIASPIESENDVRDIVAGFAHEQRALDALEAAVLDLLGRTQPEPARWACDCDDYLTNSPASALCVDCGHELEFHHDGACTRETVERQKVVFRCQCGHQVCKCGHVREWHETGAGFCEHVDETIDEVCGCDGFERPGATAEEAPPEPAPGEWVPAVPPVSAPEPEPAPTKWRSSDEVWADLVASCTCTGVVCEAESEPGCVACREADPYMPCPADPDDDAAPELTPDRPAYPTQAITDAWTWWVVPDDLVGGWAIATTNQPVSEQSPPSGWTVATFVSRDVADHIVALHNDATRQKADAARGRA